MQEAKMFLMPAKQGTCPICATEHDPDYPHNKQSLYYQMRFQIENGRSATWKDAMEHCSDLMKEMWTEALLKRGEKIE